MIELSAELEDKLDALIAEMPPLTDAQVEAAARILATIEQAAA